MKLVRIRNINLRHDHQASIFRDTFEFESSIEFLYAAVSALHKSNSINGCNVYTADVGDVWLRNCPSDGDLCVLRGESHGMKPIYALAKELEGIKQIPSKKLTQATILAIPLVDTDWDAAIEDNAPDVVATYLVMKKHGIGSYCEAVSQFTLR